MRTMHENISEALIRKHKVNNDVRELNDPRYPLRFRYLSDRERGSWYYVRGGRWHWIGSYPLIKFAKVRDMLPVIEINIASGIDERAAVVGHFETVSDLLDWHLNRVVMRQQLTPLRKQGIKTAINRYLLPFVGDLYLADVSHHELDSRLMLPIQTKYSLSTIRLAFGVLKTAFKGAFTHKLIDVDPLASMSFTDFISDPIEPKPIAFEPRRSYEVFKQITKANYQARTLALLMLVHGTRIGETRQARWDEIDLKNGTWFIPADKTKTHQAITLPLTELSIAILSKHKAEQSKRGYRGVWVFRGSKLSALTPKQANELIQEASNRQWTAHDLRKAFKGIMNIVGVDYLIGEKLLNHSLTILDKTYNQAELFEKMQAATLVAHRWFIEHGATLNDET